MKTQKMIKFVAVIICLTVLAGIVQAADIQTRAGDTVTYTVSLAEAASFAGFKVYLDYDKEVFSLITEDGEYFVEQGSFSSKGTMLANVTGTGCGVLWYHTNNVTATGTLFSVKLQVSANAPAGTYPVTLRYESADTVNVDGEEVMISLSGESNIVVAGEVNEENTKITLNECSGLVGDLVSIPVYIVRNPGFSGLTIEIQEIPGVAFVSAKKGNLFGSNETGTLTFNPGSRVISWIDSENTTGDGELFVLDFQIDENCVAGDYNIVLALKEGLSLNFVDCDANAIPVDFSAGKLTVVDYVLGDVDDDGQITGSDAVKMSRHIVGYEFLSGKAFKSADIDADGKITSADCVKMARYLVGLITSFS